VAILGSGKGAACEAGSLGDFARLAVLQLLPEASCEHGRRGILRGERRPNGDANSAPHALATCCSERAGRWGGHLALKHATAAVNSPRAPDGFRLSSIALPVRKSMPVWTCRLSTQTMSARVDIAIRTSYYADMSHADA
jgi:hypothetical protein